MVKFKFNNVLKWLDLQKEGALVGALIASILLTIHNNMPTDLTNSFIQILPAGWWQQLSVALFIGMMIGAIIDSIYKPKR